MDWTELLGKVPTLVWVLLFLLFGPPALGSKTAAKLPWIFGAFGKWWQARRVAVVSQDELGRLNAELHALREDYDRDVPALRNRVDRLEAALNLAQRQLWAFRDHTRALLSALRIHAPEAPLPDPPDEIRDLV